MPLDGIFDGLPKLGVCHQLQSFHNSIPITDQSRQAAIFGDRYLYVHFDRLMLLVVRGHTARRESVSR